MDKDTKELFNAIIGELDRMQDKIERRFDKIDDTLEIMHHEINTCKLE